jgi:hypothetical protein
MGAFFTLACVLTNKIKLSNRTVVLRTMGNEPKPSMEQLLLTA